MSKPACNLLWFKRDLRLDDHAALAAAAADGLPVLLCFFFEPDIMALPEHSARHWQFVWASVCCVKERLARYGHPLYVFHAEAAATFSRLAGAYDIKNLFSHQETGLAATFLRDKAVAAFCRQGGIRWQEFAQDGVARGAKDRTGWEARVQAYLSSEPVQPDLSRLRPVVLPEGLYQTLKGPPLPAPVLAQPKGFQPGGEIRAHQYLRSFLGGRAANYHRHLSKPGLSRTACSRLSPYLAYGNLSSRQVYRAALGQGADPAWERPLASFRSRLWWRCHFLQKFESDCRMEKEHINPGFDLLEKPHDPQLFNAWAEGRTGYPVADASMRCLSATGYLNFRMRAMLVSFLCFPLWQDWRPGAAHLARLFLDFEPGIHYPQFQMQAGTTGYHTLRIYNPVGQAEKHDPDGSFVKQWLPELQKIPVPLLYRPWLMTPMEQAFYGCRLGTDYPYPVVDFGPAARKAKALYWEARQSQAVQERLPAIWRRLCLPQEAAKHASGQAGPTGP